MKDFILLMQFVFRDFWTFWGFAILLSVASSGAVGILRAIYKSVQELF